MAACEKAVKNWGINGRENWGIVKKFIQKHFELLGKWGQKENLWEKSGKVYTNKLFNYPCGVVSFPSFAQTSTTATNFLIEYKKKGEIWK